jgi:hypothetical protein
MVTLHSFEELQERGESFVRIHFREKRRSIDVGMAGHSFRYDGRMWHSNDCIYRYYYNDTLHQLMRQLPKALSSLIYRNAHQYRLENNSRINDTWTDERIRESMFFTDEDYPWKQFVL